MTSSEVRQSFLNFFKSKGHTIVPSSSLMPDAPNLLFTNAGMNQFVPIFLGQRAPDVDKWAGAIAGSPTRAADTQKCIRAGGKHNDLEDVGLDTYHHTFFEMLGNWSFGDYFKKEAIEWAWELVTEIWKFPQNRLYATVYKPGPGDPAEFDQEAYDHWARLFSQAGLDPKVHIQFGGKKDNFWMMGDTGPCGPCSEIHIDLTPQGDTQGKLVNTATAECIEIWNLVFIQFNANPDGTYSALPARHVDTGMGFERVTGIMQCTKNFTDFSRVVSNYESDVFRPLFKELEKLSGKHYGSTLPASGSTGASEQEKRDVAFRVIADHIRTLAFAIADGIEPGNTGRNYVLRRILRRAVSYGRTLSFHEPFFYKLVDTLAETMGDVFPELRTKQQHVKEIIRIEEEEFNKNLDNGNKVFSGCVEYKRIFRSFLSETKEDIAALEEAQRRWREVESDEGHKEVEKYGLSISNRAARHQMFYVGNIESREQAEFLLNLQKFGNKVASTLIRSDDPATIQAVNADLGGLHEAVVRGFQTEERNLGVLSGSSTFLLYGTYGFPLDLTELKAREHGLTVDLAGFNKLMEEERDRARKAQKRQIVSITARARISPPATNFIGYKNFQSIANVQEILRMEGKIAVIVDTTPFYPEGGGQVGDTGEFRASGKLWRIINTSKIGANILHVLSEEPEGLAPGLEVQLSVDKDRRAETMRHHTVTHLLHWALHEVVNREATQKGSYVGPDKLTFDFASAPLTPAQVKDVEKLVNARLLENAPVSWRELPYAEIRSCKEIRQFFGEKYGDQVRVLQIGGRKGELNGYSMELCGGTHVSATGEIGLFRILSEAAIASGIRRIEAVAGLRAYDKTRQDVDLLTAAASKVNAPVNELEKKLEALLAQQKDLEKQLKTAHQKEAAEVARSLQAKAQTINSTRAIVENVGAATGDDLQAIADGLKGQFKGVVVLGGTASGAVSLIATVSPDLTSKIQAGKLIQAIAPIVGGKGGGRPDNARGGGKDTSKLNEALAKAKSLLP